MQPIDKTERFVFQNSQRVLLTGSSGFLGQALCQQLRKNGAYVIGIDKNALTPTKRPSACTLTVPQAFIQLDLANPQLSQLLAKQAFDTVFHLAGMAYATQSVQAPEQDFAQNLAATFNLLDALRKNAFTGRFVYTSTAAVYGQPQQLPIGEESETRPISPYGVSKLAAEEYIRVFSRCYGFSAVIGRLFSLYGPRQQKQVVFDILCKTLLNDGPIELLGDGQEVRDFVYVDDAAQALLWLAEHATIDAPIVNICSASGITIYDLAHSIITLAGENPKRLRFTEYRRNGDPTHWIGCNKKLLDTGSFLTYTLSEGLAETVAWFRQTYDI